MQGGSNCVFGITPATTPRTRLLGTYNIKDNEPHELSLRSSQFTTNSQMTRIRATKQMTFNRTLFTWVERATRLCRDENSWSKQKHTPAVSIVEQQLSIAEARWCPAAGSSPWRQQHCTRPPVDEASVAMKHTRTYLRWRAVAAAAAWGDGSEVPRRHRPAYSGRYAVQAGCIRTHGACSKAI